MDPLRRSSTRLRRRPTSGRARRVQLPEPASPAFPPTLPFRPPRLTPRPVVKGTQTAVVVGPKGEEIFTDKYGRVKVQFHWDREGKNDDDSSCWVRVGAARGGAALGRLLLAADRPGGDRRLPRGRPGPADHRRQRLQRRPDAAVPREGSRREAQERQQGDRASSRTRRTGAQGSTSGASTTPRTRSRSSSTPSGTWTSG